MNRFTDAIRQCLASQNWYAALFMALAMPDICSKLEHPSSSNSGLRYREWFDKYLGPVYTVNIMESRVEFMNGGDCWALRCSMLHEGSHNVGEQKARETLSRFRFTSLNHHRVRLNDDVLVLNVGRFCEEMCQAVETWSKVAAQSADVSQRIAKVVKVDVDGSDLVPLLSRRTRKE
jgi:hypothetical protein